MVAQLHEITSRHKNFAPLFSEISDFTFGHTSEVLPDVILSSVNWSLYCLDFKQGKALFVEMPDGTDLADAPFVYGAQFENAKRAISLPLDLLPALGSKVAPPPQLAFLFSTGRCGSTLASRIFAQLPDVWSLSEPDCYTNLVSERRNVSEAAAADILRAATHLICRPPAGRSPKTVVIKMRSEAILQAEAYHTAFPNSFNVFMYRDVEGYANSAYKFSQRIMGQEAFFASKESWRPVWSMLMVNAPLSLLGDYFSKDHGEIGWEEFMTLLWEMKIEGYLRALRRGGRFQAIHYDDLNTNRAAETARLLTSCGIFENHLAQAMRAFEQDSHKGSASENSVPAKSLDDRQWANVHALMKRLGRRDYREERLPESGRAA